MQLFWIGDILEMRDKSQWEVIGLNQDIYSLQNVYSGKIELDNEHSLDKRAIVVQFSDKMPKIQRKLAKVYYLEEYRKKREEKLLNAQKGEVK